MIYTLRISYSDSDYCCPHCGTSSTECTPSDWGYICSTCGEYFETPDV